MHPPQQTGLSEKKYFFEFCSLLSDFCKKIWILWNFPFYCRIFVGKWDFSEILLLVVAFLSENKTLSEFAPPSTNCWIRAWSCIAVVGFLLSEITVPCDLSVKFMQITCSYVKFDEEIENRCCHFWKEIIGSVWRHRGLSYLYSPEIWSMMTSQWHDLFQRWQHRFSISPANFT